MPTDISKVLPENVRAVLIALTEVRRRNATLVEATGAVDLPSARRIARGSRKDQVVKALSKKVAADKHLIEVTGTSHVGAAIARAKRVELRVEDLKRGIRRETSRRSPNRTDDRDASSSLRTLSGGLPGLGKGR